MKLTDPVAENEELRQFVRRHSHDFRNNFNGIEMELLLMEGTLDGGGLDCIERIRKEVNALENGLRYLENRFAEPELQIVSALDVFNQWKSRCCAIRDDQMIWECSFSNVSINVDMQMVADTLCEWVCGMKSAVPGRIFGELCEDEICFGVEPGTAVDGLERAEESLSPGFVSLIEGNGGRYRENVSPDGGIKRSICCFPVTHSD